MSLRPRRNMKRQKSPEEEASPSGEFDCEDVTVNNTIQKRSRQSSKKPCLNRNALMARANRQRKKAYVEKIESKLSFYQQQNEQLVSTVQKQSAAIKRLSSEVAYLRNILNNNSAITSLLKAINRNLGVASGERIQQTNDSNSVSSGGLSTSSRGPFNVSTEGSNRKNLPTRNIAYSFPNIDHAYMQTNSTETNNTEEIIMPDPMCPETIGNYAEVEETSPESFSSGKADDLCNDNIMGSIIKDDLSVDLDLDQLSPVNVDIFEDLQKFDEAAILNDNLSDAPNFFKEEDLFRNLNDMGICLHVNSDRVSLEFCPTCHSNSMNSGVD